MKLTSIITTAGLCLLAAGTMPTTAPAENLATLGDKNFTVERYEERVNELRMKHEMLSNTKYRVEPIPEPTGYIYNGAKKYLYDQLVEKFKQQPDWQEKVDAKIDDMNAKGTTGSPKQLYTVYQTMISSFEAFSELENPTDADYRRIYQEEVIENAPKEVVRVMEYSSWKEQIVFYRSNPGLIENLQIPESKLQDQIKPRAIQLLIMTDIVYERLKNSPEVFKDEELLAEAAEVAEERGVDMDPKEALYHLLTKREGGLYYLERVRMDIDLATEELQKEFNEFLKGHEITIRDLSTYHIDLLAYDPIDERFQAMMGP